MKYFFTLLLLLCPSFAYAATLILVPMPAVVGVGDLVSITVRTESTETLNTFSGSLDYPPALVPVSISDGSSIVSLWVTTPIRGTPGSIPFAGVTPGGFSGNGKLFSVVFRAHDKGQAQLALSHVQLLLNDGKGTAAGVLTQPLVLNIKALSQGGFVQPNDTDPPEPFTPLLEKGPDGKFYLDFSAADKKSGVDHYEVSENRIYKSHAPVFETATSPYVLEDQYLSSDITVRAVDGNGNIRTETYPHTHVFRPYEEGMLVGTLVLLAVLVYLFLHRRLRTRNTL